MSDITEETTTLVLSELGLNEYETRAYLTVLEGGTIVARAISDRSSIPYAKVYQVLESLEYSKELITGDKGRPRKFKCNNPERAILNLLKSIEMEWKTKQKRREELVNRVLPELLKLYKTSRPDISDEQGVWTYVGLANIISKVSSLLASTRSVLRISSGNSKLLVTKFSNMLSDLQGIDIIIQTDEPVEELDHYKIKIVSTIGTATTFIFDDFAQISIVETQGGKYTAGEYTAVCIQISPLVKSSIIDFTRAIK